MADARFGYDTVALDEVLCESRAAVSAADITAFRRLMGYPDEPADATAVAPSSMGLTYGLRLGWEHAVFPPGVIRMGDEDRFGVPARAGDELVTQLRVVDRFERKGRRFMKYEMRTRNQRDELVCEVVFVAMMP
jgi:hypothetical protein